MRITEVSKVEDCFDGSTVFRYAFDRPWVSESIPCLSELGRLDYFADFPRPFFRLVADSGMQVKGIEGEQTCLVILPRRDTEVVRQQFEGLFLPSQGYDHSKVKEHENGSKDTQIL